MGGKGVNTWRDRHDWVGGIVLRGLRLPTSTPICLFVALIYTALSLFAGQIRIYIYFCNHKGHHTLLLIEPSNDREGGVIANKFPRFWVREGKVNKLMRPPISSTMPDIICIFIRIPPLPFAITMIQHIQYMVC